MQSSAPCKCQVSFADDLAVFENGRLSSETRHIFHLFALVDSTDDHRRIGVSPRRLRCSVSPRGMSSPILDLLVPYLSPPLLPIPLLLLHPHPAICSLISPLIRTHLSTLDIPSAYVHALESDGSARAMMEEIGRQLGLAQGKGKGREDDEMEKWKWKGWESFVVDLEARMDTSGAVIVVEGIDRLKGGTGLGLGGIGCLLAGLPEQASLAKFIVSQPSTLTACHFADEESSTCAVHLGAPLGLSSSFPTPLFRSFDYFATRLHSSAIGNIPPSASSTFDVRYSSATATLPSSRPTSPADGPDHSSFTDCPASNRPFALAFVDRVRIALPQCDR